MEGGNSLPCALESGQCRILFYSLFYHECHKRRSRRCINQMYEYNNKYIEPKLLITSISFVESKHYYRFSCLCIMQTGFRKTCTTQRCQMNLSEFGHTFQPAGTMSLAFLNKAGFLSLHNPLTSICRSAYQRYVAGDYTMVPYSHTGVYFNLCHCSHQIEMGEIV